MKLNISKTTTVINNTRIELSESDVAVIIAEYLNANVGPEKRPTVITPDDVEFQVGQVFKGAVISVKHESTKKG